MSDEKPLCSLVETRAYKHCLERREIWQWILEAIRDNEWFDEVAAGAPLYAVQLLHAVVSGNFDPAQIMWGRENTASEAKFDKWLKEAKRSHQFPARQKRRPGSKPGLREKIAEFIKDEYLDDPPPGVTDKEIARRAKDKLSLDRTPCERTVRRARGRQ
jgi:hypothetical protein